ncbi:type III-B CRISPR module-associated Cmr3 family protein [Clostridium sp. MB40-C1]|uniref:type III-B CRISPR module-associated Cmr3 family protein n=1 Tax=Clostridium sp. MB40-C1 TaxID=3070996 RepID=UPI0027E1794E|nr:type III-B CRISPR module-associated Cmr3 family protein [Clostridium sp. MB40-C1]WMJ82285.1 type III-B CRISPR module-associated Cmr3 family protein [Clostridium sp. MB40-C1]
MMKNKYLVTLKPMGSFFFGSERTFGLGEDNEHYIIQSECFPQQTSILGMLRKEMLIIKNLIRYDWNYNGIYDKVNTLIGSKSFNINDIEKQQFGVIEKIYPVFIKKENKYLISVPKDHKVKKVIRINKNKINEIKKINIYNKKYRILNFNKRYVSFNKRYVPFNFNKNKKCEVNFGNNKEENKTIYIPCDYIAKDGLATGFMDKGKNIINFNDVFKEDKQIGINVDKNKQTRIDLQKNKQTSEDGLYKIIRYRLENDYEFAFNIDVNFNTDFKESDLDGYSNVVNLGGEGSYFKISFKKVDKYITDDFENTNEVNDKEDKIIYKKMILLSDTYISKEKYDKYCDYGIVNGITFRNLKTDYSKFKEEGEYYKKFEKTNKFIFLERGSVLFSLASNYEKLKMQIETNQNVRNIGYNEYV